MSSSVDSQPPVLTLLELAHRLRQASSADELAFLAVNESRRLLDYRQAALWFENGGTTALSGIVEVEHNVPYTQWLDKLCRHLGNLPPKSLHLTAAALPETIGAEWPEWLPEFGLWLPLTTRDTKGGLLLAGDHEWSAETLALLEEWMGLWHLAWRAHHPHPRWSRAKISASVRAWLARGNDRPLWQQRRVRVAAAVLAVLFFPVRLTVLAQGELVAANPAVIRAPLDGIVSTFHVHPNEAVKSGQLLFGFDEAPIAARIDVATQAQATAEAEYRQFAQQALSDSKSKNQLATLLGKIEEKRVDADYLRAQLERSRVVAPRDGIALFDDPTEWIGKPVQTGERIMRIADPADAEVEAWVPLGDAIPLPQEAPVDLYLAASPFSSLSARLRYMAHDAVVRPDGSYAYRLRARLDVPTTQRIGLKGTAKLHGPWVPLIYWVLRRPLATIRQTLGL